MARLLRTLRERVSSAGIHHGGANVVAFSGGVDSSVVAALVNEAFPRNSMACVGVSAALPAVQLDLARSVAAHIGIELREVATSEGDDPEYVANLGKSCFHCKTHLYSALEAVAAAAATEAATAAQRTEAFGGSSSGSSSGSGSSCHSAVTSGKNGEKKRVMLFNGTNADDRSDPTRVGLRAAADFGVASPIEFLTKSEVREVAKALGLPNWNAAASPCLRSRLANGVAATRERLQKIETAEAAARRFLLLKPTQNLRVRAVAGGGAVLEVDKEALPLALEALAGGNAAGNSFLASEAAAAEGYARNNTEMAKSLGDAILSLGFASLSVREFRSGGVSGYRAPAAASVAADSSRQNQEASCSRW